MKIVTIIQARMGSTRLSGKVMKDLLGQTVLAHVIDRVKQSKLVNEIIIATTTEERDNIIEIEALNNGVKCFRGSETDVLSRYYLAAKEHDADVVVRITSDCPLYDPNILDEMICFYQTYDYSVVTNAGDICNRTFPRGLDTEIFSFDLLKEAFLKAKEGYQREHVTPYIYENKEFIYYYKNDTNYSYYRWTLDTLEDWELISKIYKNLYHGIHDFYFDDIIKLMKKYPDLHNINKDIEQKEIK